MTKTFAHMYTRHSGIIIHTYQELHVMVVGRVAVFFKVALYTVLKDMSGESL